MTKIPETVFGTLVKDKTYDTFINSPDNPGAPDFKKCVELYKTLLNKNKISLEYLAKLEEVITQMRCRESAIKEIKLSQVRGYIYARAPFFFLKSKKKDIRVTVGKILDHGDDLDVLLKDKEFIKEAKKKIVVKMTNEITGNLMDIEEFEENTLIII